MSRAGKPDYICYNDDRALPLANQRAFIRKAPSGTQWLFVGYGMWGPDVWVENTPGTGGCGGCSPGGGGSPAAAALALLAAAAIVRSRRGSDRTCRRAFPGLRRTGRRRLREDLTVARRRSTIPDAGGDEI